MALIHFVCAALLAAILYSIKTYVFSRRSGATTLPPGPPPNLILGNALQLPKTQPWVRMTEWSRTYGDVMFMRILQRPFIVLSSHDAITDLLEKRSTIYSLRPLRNMAQLSGFGKALLFQSNAETVRRSRKLMHGEFNSRDVTKHQALQHQEAQRMAFRALDDSTPLVENLRLTAAAALLSITYGYHIKDASDPLLSMAENVMNDLAEVITPNKFLVDALPPLKHVPNWFPGAGFKLKAEASKRLLERFMQQPFSKVIDEMNEGFALPSFTSNLLENRLDSLSEDDLDLFKWTSGGIYAAGSDTTISVLSSFFLAMLLHPEAQTRAQEEIDRVVGHDALPSFLDRGSLPFIEAIIKEVYRWNPAAPLISRGMSHDDEYRGYFIPSKAVVMVNVWALTHNESVYKNPSEFNPGRFLDDASNSKAVPDPRDLVFGFGRRSCPGSHLADNLVYIIVATTLAVFRIEPELDNEGNPIIPKVEYSTGAVSHPAPFKCRQVPRSQNAAKLVRHAVEF